ncbi:Uncharacterised protein [Mycobacteroides abscessus subsp. bolletii]|nr:Uncharacterised protein [Mycobacteroides abscessus]SKF61593.1 Uncharacterised protein [Mycobacteroides abscessus subsp. bolletii]SKH86142.1 Uncharacterised protein [Mycobacteroides abscessus subsp. bolletii]SLI61869.1 Uncharacterised protein [Mycobacteroides abscessus subsp. bolletii]
MPQLTSVGDQLVRSQPLGRTCPIDKWLGARTLSTVSHFPASVCAEVSGDLNDRMPVDRPGFGSRFLSVSEAPLVAYFP